MKGVVTVKPFLGNVRVISRVQSHNRRAAEGSIMPTTKTILTVAVFLVLLRSERSVGQEKGTPISFHITAVRSEEAYDTEQRCQGDCDARRYAVEGYSDATEYVLTCVELTAHKPSAHLVIACARLHANNDYAARRFADSIAFVEYKPQSPDEPLAANYDIVSEKEVHKQQK